MQKLMQSIGGALMTTTVDNRDLTKEELRVQIERIIKFMRHSSDDKETAFETLQDLLEELLDRLP